MIIPTKFEPIRPLASEKILCVNKFEDQIEIIVPVKKDHPMIITIDLTNNTFDVEGYD